MQNHLPSGFKDSSLGSFCGLWQQTVDPISSREFTAADATHCLYCSRSPKTAANHRKRVEPRGDVTLMRSTGQFI